MNIFPTNNNKKIRTAAKKAVAKERKTKEERIKEFLTIVMQIGIIAFILGIASEPFLFCEDVGGKCFTGKGLLKGETWNWNGENRIKQSILDLHNPSFKAPAVQSQDR
jgi:hypothetical protein